MLRSIRLGPGVFAIAVGALFLVMLARPAAAQTPTNLQITVNGYELAMTWTRPAGACGTTQIEIGRQPGGNDAASIYVGPISIYRYTFPYTGTYYVRVRCGLGPPSNEVQVVIGLGAPPSPPEDVRAAVTGTRLTVTWAQTSSGITGYRLEAGTAPSLSNLGVVPVTGTSFSVANVPAGTYYLRVRSVGPSGQSAPSSEVQATIGPGGTPPGIPGAIQTTVNGNNVFVSWGAATGNVSNYNLEGGSAPNLANLGSLTATSTLVNIPGVPPGTYYLRVRAVGPGGQSAPTPDAAVTVGGGCIPPSTPQNFTGSANGAQVTISWQPPATGSTPLTYTLAAGPAPGLNSVVMPMGAALSVQTVAPAGTYYVRVAASNACGTKTSSDISITVQ